MPKIQSGNMLSKYSLEIRHNSRVEKNAKLMEVDYFIVIKKLSIRKGELLTQGHSSIFLLSALCLSVPLSVPEYSLEGLMLKLKLQHFGQLM